MVGKTVSGKQEILRDVSQIPLLVRDVDWDETVDDVPNRSAQAELETWVGETLRRCAAGLAWGFPEQARFVFDGVLDRAYDVTTVCEVVLDRLDALERGDGRRGARRNDEAALAL